MVIKDLEYLFFSSVWTKFLYKGYPKIKRCKLSVKKFTPPYERQCRPKILEKTYSSFCPCFFFFNRFFSMRIEVGPAMILNSVRLL